MTEVVLLLVIFGLCGLVAWMEHSNRKERKSMLNAMIAKDAVDMTNLELADKTKIEVKPKKNDLVPESELSDDEFEKYVVNPKQVDVI